MSYFGNLKKINNTELFFSSDLVINMSNFELHDRALSEFRYIIEGAKPDRLPNQPVSRVTVLVIRGKYDSGHMPHAETMRSCTRLLFFLRNFPIYLFSNKKFSVESRSFG